METDQATVDGMKAEMGCCFGDACPTEKVFTDTYCWQDCCDPATGICSDEYCTDVCEDNSWTSYLDCNNPYWFTEHLVDDWKNSFVECGCTNSPVAISG